MNNITKKNIGLRINTALAKEEKLQKDLAKVLDVSDNTISFFAAVHVCQTMNNL